MNQTLADLTEMENEWQKGSLYRPGLWAFYSFINISAAFLCWFVIWVIYFRLPKITESQDSSAMVANRPPPPAAARNHRTTGAVAPPIVVITPVAVIIDPLVSNRSSFTATASKPPSPLPLPPPRSNKPEKTLTAGQIFISGLMFACSMMSITCGMQCFLNLIGGRQQFEWGSVACDIEAFAHVTNILLQFFSITAIATAHFLSIHDISVLCGTDDRAFFSSSMCRTCSCVTRDERQRQKNRGKRCRYYCCTLRPSATMDMSLGPTVHGKRFKCTPSIAKKCMVMMIVLCYLAIFITGRVSEIYLMPAGAYCFYKFDSPVILLFVTSFACAALLTIYLYLRIYTYSKQTMKNAERFMARQFPSTPGSPQSPRWSTPNSERKRRQQEHQQQQQQQVLLQKQQLLHLARAPTTGNQQPVPTSSPRSLLLIESPGNGPRMLISPPPPLLQLPLPLPLQTPSLESPPSICSITDNTSPTVLDREHHQLVPPPPSSSSSSPSLQSHTMTSTSSDLLQPPPPSQQQRKFPHINSIQSNLQQPQQIQHPVAVPPLRVRSIDHRQPPPADDHDDPNSMTSELSNRILQRSSMYVVIFVVGWFSAIILLINEICCGHATQGLDTSLGVFGSLHSLAAPMAYTLTNRDIRQSIASVIASWWCCCCFCCCGNGFCNNNDRSKIRQQINRRKQPNSDPPPQLVYTTKDSPNHHSQDAFECLSQHHLQSPPKTAFQRPKRKADPGAPPAPPSPLPAVTATVPMTATVVLTTTTITSAIVAVDPFEPIGSSRDMKSMDYESTRNEQIAVTEVDQSDNGIMTHLPHLSLPNQPDHVSPLVESNMPHSYQTLRRVSSKAVLEQHDDQQEHIHVDEQQQQEEEEDDDNNNKEDDEEDEEKEQEQDAQNQWSTTIERHEDIRSSEHDGDSDVSTNMLIPPIIPPQPQLRPIPHMIHSRNPAVKGHDEAKRIQPGSRFQAVSMSSFKLNPTRTSSATTTAAAEKSQQRTSMTRDTSQTGSVIDHVNVVTVEVDH
jgi:hypothetical protein